MRTFTVLSFALILHVALSLPVNPEVSQVAIAQEQEPQLTLHNLDLGEPVYDPDAARDKRTIGFLRTLFPGLSELIDRQIQNLTRYLFRLVGRLVLGGGGGGGGSTSDSSSSAGSTGNRRISITLPTYAPDSEDDEEEDESDDENETKKREVRSPYDGQYQQFQPYQYQEDQSQDQAVAASENVESQAQDSVVAASETDQEVDESEREKRGFSLGGSGNFLFDIIRLIAGSGSTEEADESLGGDGDEAKSSDASASGDGYTSGVPGPITRLFIIANRGISNLLQDLILRLAQTSERIVNFKARLITSII